jgi:hypothetical protein
MSTTEPDEPAIPGEKDELDKWNWGGFLWNWIWAIGHGQVAKGLVAFIVNLFIPVVAGIYFGLKGNRIAWENGSYASKEELRQRERKWVKAWFVFVGVVVALVVVVVVATG